MSYTYITKHNSPNYTPGRGGKKITSITIHWWGDPASNPSFEGVVSWLCNRASQVSAHYVATGTLRRVACIVDPDDTAWHAGNWNGNLTSVGIECDPRCRDADYHVVAELVANLWKTYGKVPLRPHKYWTATRCPGNYDLARIKGLAEQYYADKAVNYTALITAAYKELLGRNPDAGGLRTYTSRMKGGWSIAQVKADIKKSTEYKNRQLRLAAEAARLKAEAAAKAKAEAAKAEAERLEAEAQAQKEKQMAEVIQENNSLLKQILEFLTNIFKGVR